MNKLKIGQKLFLSYFLIISLFFFVTVLSFNMISYNHLVKQAQEDLQKEGNKIASVLESSYNGPLTSRLLQQFFEKNRKMPLINRRAILDVQFFVMNNDGDILYANANESVVDIWLQDKNNFSKQYVSQQLAITDYENQMLGTIFMFTEIEGLQEVNAMMWNTLFISLAISAILAILVGYMMQRNITNPVRLLNGYMKKFSLKAKQAPLSMKGNDEIKELSDTFQELTTRLQSYDIDQKQFLQNASHELKTPLMAIQGNAEAIMDEIVTGEDATQSLNIIIQECQRLKLLVEEISYLTRLQTVEETFRFQEENIHVILDETIQSMKPLLDQNHITLNWNSEVYQNMICDPDKLKQTFINVISNSIRYAKSNIDLQLLQEKQNMMITISDDGPGFKAGDEQKIFQRFYKGEQGGTGIGLAIAKVIVEKHGGTIIAKANQPHGALFEITLPIQYGSNKKITKSVNNKKAMIGKKRGNNEQFSHKERNK
ncbi:sensor histidine kinase [Longirhabdus pacifica]|uniref:sensor histidine kinase n=1 Tax=Longirhabdus pacifica TaxID=2305227 RepID=UPI001F0C8907|nr:HAMP domain-containing sensor histidine kinase [Longirhabdus pacifica]